MIFLDTNALVRFFTKDDNTKAEKVKNLLTREEKIIIPEVVFPEIEYVLKGLYGSTKNELFKIFEFLTTRKNIKLNKIVRQAVILYQKSNLDIADCLIVAHSFKGQLASFDSDLLKTPGVKRYWK